MYHIETIIDNTCNKNFKIGAYLVLAGFHKDVAEMDTQANEFTAINVNNAIVYAKRYRTELYDGARAAHKAIINDFATMEYQQIADYMQCVYRMLKQPAVATIMRQFRAELIATEDQN